MKTKQNDNDHQAVLNLEPLAVELKCSVDRAVEELSDRVDRAVGVLVALELVADDNNSSDMLNDLAPLIRHARQELRDVVAGVSRARWAHADGGRETEGTVQ
jgi:hypothetical protein